VIVICAGVLGRETPGEVRGDTVKADGGGKMYGEKKGCLNAVPENLREGRRKGGSRKDFGPYMGGEEREGGQIIKRRDAAGKRSGSAVGIWGDKSPLKEKGRKDAGQGGNRRG